MVRLPLSGWKRSDVISALGAPRGRPPKLVPTAAAAAQAPRRSPPLRCAQGYCTWCPYLNKWCACSHPPTARLGLCVCHAAAPIPPPRITFTASIGVALCSGLTYVFAIWSGALKATYNLRQDQLELIASFSNAGGYFGIFSGLTFDALLPHKKFGPRFVLALGLLANAGGYLGLWAAASG